jgi:hypothetical protein
VPHPAAPVAEPVTKYPGVTSVKAADDHRLILSFGDGEQRVFDVTPLLSFGRFRELASPEVFKKVRIAYDTVEWENGLDLDPEYLYERSLPI